MTEKRRGENSVIDEDHQTATADKNPWLIATMIGFVEVGFKIRVQKKGKREERACN